MPRLIGQVYRECQWATEDTRTGFLTQGLPHSCRLTTLRIVYADMHASATHFEVSVGEDILNKYPIIEYNRLAVADLKLSVSTVGCHLINLDYDYVQDVENAYSVGSIWIWIKRIGGPVTLHTAHAYLTYAVS